KGHFLVLEQDFSVGEHHLHITGERRHPRKVHGLERFGCQHCDDAGYRGGLGGVDLLDSGMAVGGAREIAVEHAGQPKVVDVIALALNETNVLDTLSLATHALQGFGALRGGGGLVVHSAASWNGTPLILAAAYRMALTMFWYPVQRHRLPAMPKRISSSVEGLFSCGNLKARLFMHGVQKPHRRPCISRNPSCSGCSVPSAFAIPSMVRISAPFACTANKVQDLTDLSSRSTVQAPQCDVSQPICEPVKFSCSRRK